MGTTRRCSECGELKSESGEIRRGARRCQACIRKPRVCERCLEEKVPPREIDYRAKYCRVCRPIHRRELKTQHYLKNRERIRAREHARYLANAEKVKARVARWRKENPEAVRLSKAKYEARVSADPVLAEGRRTNKAKNWRDWWERLRADPERYAEYLEKHRMGARLRKERQGLQVSPVPIGRYRQQYGLRSGGFVQTAPLRPLIAAWLAESEFNTYQRLADCADMPDERWLREIVAGRQAKLSRSTADAICIALGLHFDLVYMEEDAA